MPRTQEPGIDQWPFLLHPLFMELEALATGKTMPIVPPACRQNAGDLGERLVSVILAMITCDQVGLRKLLGFCGHAAKDHFCTKCRCKLVDIFKFHLRSAARTSQQHVANGRAWLSAQSQAARTKVREETGSRYSPLATLPGVDAIKVPSTDVLHQVDLGVIKNQCVDLSTAGVLVEKTFLKLQTQQNPLRL